MIYFYWGTLLDIMNRARSVRSRNLGFGCRQGQEKFLLFKTLRQTPISSQLPVR